MAFPSINLSGLKLKNKIGVSVNENFCLKKSFVIKGLVIGVAVKDFVDSLQVSGFYTLLKKLIVINLITLT